MGTKLLLHLLATGLGARRASGTPGERQDDGMSLAVILLALLAVIVSTVAVANRTAQGLLGASQQSGNREARDVAEAGINKIVSEWNIPANRGMWTAGNIAMGNWSTSSPKNNCTGLTKDSKTGAYTLDTTKIASLTAAATTAINSGAELQVVTGDNSRTFILRRITYLSQDRKTAQTYTPISKIDQTAPFSNSDSTTGVVQLEVEGIFRRNGQIQSRSTVTRDLEVAPMCCLLSFGAENQPYGGKLNLGTETRPCYGGVNLGDLSFAYGLSGGSGKTAGTVTIDTPKGKATGLTCYNPKCNETTLNGITVNNIKLVFPNPPTLASIATLAGKSVPSAVSVPATKGKDATFDSSTSKACIAYSNAYHCNVTSMPIAGATLTVNTPANWSTYFYVSGAVDLGGAGQLIHNYDGKASGPQDTGRFQIRGIPNKSTTGAACSTTQSVTMAGTPAANVFLWMPCGNVKFSGTSGFNGILWVNNIDANGTVDINMPFDSGGDGGDCANPSIFSIYPCDKFSSVFTTKAKNWTARSTFFTKLF